MRLTSYRNALGESWGVLIDERVVDRSRLGMELPGTIKGLIEMCQHDATLVEQITVRANKSPSQDLDSVELLPCIPRPGKIICLGVNYVDHAKEGGNSIADYPVIFFRSGTSLLAHGAPLRVPKISSNLDFEAELALVIGKTTRFVAQEKALESVFGYACFNDATLRDYQKRTSQWTIGKNFDGTGGFGPALVTADELPDGCAGLRIQSRLNGQVMQDASTTDMVFGVARTISLLSEALTLEAGDVVVMGTPGGVGYARSPPVWMKAGDTIEIEIERVGLLSNPVTA